MATKKEVDNLRMSLSLAEAEIGRLKKDVEHARMIALNDIMKAIEGTPAENRDTIITIVRALSVRN